MKAPTWEEIVAMPFSAEMERQFAAVISHEYQTSGSRQPDLFSRPTLPLVAPLAVASSHPVIACGTAVIQQQDQTGENRE